MLKKDDLVDLMGKSANAITEKLKDMGNGDMGAAPLKIYESGRLQQGLIDFCIYSALGAIIWAVPKAYDKSKVYLNKFKEKIDESNRIHNIINNNDKEDEDNTENETDNMEEQL